MASKKNTNKALFSSVIALILCCSMLVGSTFAWFTDEVKSGVNQIVAGNLDVDVLTADGESIQDKATLFDEIKLWEPGVVAYENLTVVNKGNLALKYELSINFDNENTVNGNGLSKALSVAVVPGGVSGSREQILAAAGNGVKLTELLESGALLKGEEKVYGIVIWWQPSANDNDWNVNNGKTTSDGEALHIDLGVNLHAWQKDAEKDSFDETYDAVVHTAAQLKDALQTGGNIKVVENITLPETLNVPAGVEATVDLGGKTLTGTILAPNADLTIANGTLKNEDRTASALEINAGELTLDNVQIDSARHALRVDGDVTVIINGGTYRVAAVKSQTQHALNVSGNAKVTINGGTFVGPKGTTADSGAAVNVQAGATVIINGGNFSGGKNNTLASKGTLQVYGGTFDQDPSKYLAAGYVATQNTSGEFVVGMTTDSLKDAVDNAQPGDTIVVPAGTYTFPAGSLKEGVTLQCAEGTVFDGKTSLNIDGATVVGATFTSKNSYLINQQTINGTFKNCVFKDSNGLRSAYAGETVVFENCVFDTDFYGVHFDSGANDVLFKGCTFSGFNTFGGALTKLTMEDCTFKYNGKGGYCGVNLWGDTEMIRCKFVFDGSASTEWVDVVNDGKTCTFTDCVVTDGVTEKGMETLVRNFGTGNTITINGTRMVYTNDELKAAVEAGAAKVFLADGDYDLNGIQKNGLKLIGVGDDVKVANTTKYASGKAIGAIWKAIHLENVTITNTVYTMAEGGEATFTNVKFAAGFRQGYGTDVEFTDCTFGSNSEGYALHFQTDSASEGGLITLNGCKFEGGKVHLGGKRAYEFVGCEFTAGTDFQVWSNITLDGCTVNGEEVTAANMATLFPNLDASKVTLK